MEPSPVKADYVPLSEQPADGQEGKVSEAASEGAQLIFAEDDAGHTVDVGEAQAPDLTVPVPVPEPEPEPHPEQEPQLQPEPEPEPEPEPAPVEPDVEQLVDEPVTVEPAAAVTSEPEGSAIGTDPLPELGQEAPAEAPADPSISFPESFEQQGQLDLTLVAALAGMQDSRYETSDYAWFRGWCLRFQNTACVYRWSPRACKHTCPLPI